MNNINIIQSKMELDNNEGYLELIIGPMYSGKTSALLELYKQYDFCGIKTLVINYIEDTRYSDTLLSSHNKVMIPCVQVETLSQVGDIINHDGSKDVTSIGVDFLESQVILINEGQFFKDVVEWTKVAVEKYNKTVYICGLDGDFKRNKFGNWLDLIPHCDKVTKLHSYCSKCKRKPAIFSHRLIGGEDQKLIGSSCYIPLCRGCYRKENN